MALITQSLRNLPELPTLPSVYFGNGSRKISLLPHKRDVLIHQYGIASNA
ncbi:MAG: hypothetical protein V4730_06175 [Pseudomonadota bacterium]